MRHIPRNGLVASAVATAIFSAFLPATGEGAESSRGMRVAQVDTGAAQAARVAVDIPAGDLADALKALAKQTGTDLVYRPEQVKGYKTSALKGELTAKDAIEKLLEGTNLRASTDATTGAMLIATPQPIASSVGHNDSTLRLVQSTPSPGTGEGRGEGNDQSKTDESSVEDSSKNKNRSSDTSSDSQDSQLKEFDSSKIPEILVTGSKSQNADIARTRDDSQPYVVFDAKQIERSGALNAEDFLRQRLPMNAQQGESLQVRPGITPEGGGINLRGLGANQTLILIDGRRVPGVAQGFDFGQPSISGIPMSAIERIEVLPATAGGIYGGGAVGGVINIVLKRDFSGLDLEVLYGNTFSTDVGREQISLNGGFNFEGGRTHVTISAEQARQGTLLMSDRNFGRNAFDRFARNYPTYPYLYFSAIGPTTNVLSASGADLVLDPSYGGAALNSPWTFVPDDYAGPESDGASALAANAGKLNVKGTPGALYGAPTVKSVFVNIRREMGSKLDAYINAYAERSAATFSQPQVSTLAIPAASPDNPFQQDIIVNVPIYQNGVVGSQRTKNETQRVNAGLIARLPFQWSAALDYGWARNDAPFRDESVFSYSSAVSANVQAAALTDLRTRPIPGIASVTLYAPSESHSDLTLTDFSLRLSGPLVELRGGPLTLSGLIERRRQDTDGYITSSVIDPSLPVFYYWTPPASQNVRSSYLELRAPLLSVRNKMRLIRELELTAAVRRDDYQTHFANQVVTILGPSEPFPAQSYVDADLGSTDNTLGLRYAPLRDVVLRASYGTSFLPPTFTQLLEGAPAFYPASAFAGVTDPRRGGQGLIGDPNSSPANLLGYISGGDPNIEPEKAKSFSYGFVLSPADISGLRLSIDLTDIKKSGEITGPDLQYILDNESLYPNRVVRAMNLPGDPANWEGPVTSLNVSALNLLRSEIRAVDYQLDYARDVGRWGSMHFYLVATQAKLFSRQAAATVAQKDSVGLSGGPLKWRGNAGVDWSAGPFTFGWNAQLFDSYSLCPAGFSQPADCNGRTNVQAQGTSSIPRQTYHDAYVRYHFDRAAAPLLANSEISLGVQNVFDTSPPILANGGPYSTYGDPRLRRFILTFRKHFEGGK